MQVIESIILPMPKTYPASDLDTRREVRIDSGETIHCIEVTLPGGDKALLVSPEMYAQLLKLPARYWPQPFPIF
jgi:hypothetical protein